MARSLFKLTAAMLLFWEAHRHLGRSPAIRSRGVQKPTIEPLEDRCLLSGGMADFLAPSDYSRPSGIAAGPDGNLWYTEYSGNKIGRITTAGRTTSADEFAIPSSSTYPTGITAGPDGNMWFAEVVGKIGRVNLHNTPIDITELPVLTASPIGYITWGPDGDLWFTEPSANHIGRITPTGSVSEFTVPTPNSYPLGITAGPDGNLWFTENLVNKIGRITTAGTFLNDLTVPTSTSGPHQITAGLDGNLWFTEQQGNQIGRVNLDHNPIDISEFPVLTTSAGPTFITAAPDGNIWFTEQPVNKIGRITPSGEVREFPALAMTPHLGAITVGPDSNIWFNEELANKIAKLHLLTATGVTLGEAGTAGQPLDAVVANFHDDEPGMVGSNYQVDIDWGDGTSGGQAWTAGGGNWVATGAHTYADPGHYDITVTITDMNGPNGMTATVYSSVDVDPAASSGNAGHRAGFEALADVAAALATTPRPATRLAVMTPAAGAPLHVVRQVDEAPAQPLLWLSENGNLDALRHDTEATAYAEPPAWLDLAALDLLSRSFFA